MENNRFAGRPVSIQTNWCVITGAPSSGKTSVIDELQRRGYATDNEIARELMEKLMATGKSLADIRTKQESVQELQRNILKVKMEHEASLDPQKIVFMDRGMGDSITYYRRAGLDPMTAKAACEKYRYRHVFLFERLPLQKDNIRTESDADAENIEKMLQSDYESLGYKVVRVPVLPVSGRADFIEKLVRDER